MSWHSVIFNLLLAGALLFSIWKGGAPERIGVAIAMIATIATVLALPREYPRFAGTTPAAVWVDFATFLAFTMLALAADRFWTLAAAGLQGAGVVVHFARLTQPDILPWGYSVGIAVWGYAIILLILIGTERHRRRRAARGRDPAWTASHAQPEDIRPRNDYVREEEHAS